jgi:hypothetical protein
VAASFKQSSSFRAERLYGMVGLTLAAPLTSAAVDISNGGSAGANPAPAPSS